MVIGAAGRLDLIRSLPKVYDGSHVRLPEVQVHRARHIEISVTDAPPPAAAWQRRGDGGAVSDGVPVGADGEPLPALVPGTTLTATVLPGALSLLT